MSSKDQDITLFGETNFRGIERRFGIKRGDRRRHMYVIGKTGTGKTTLQENMTIQDIQSGEGVGIVDPHGEYAERMLDFVPESRIKDVVYFDPSNLENPIAFNVLDDVGPERRHLVASGLLGVFKKIWPDVWSARMEYLLSNCILALLENPGSTLLGINRMLTDKEYRRGIVRNVTDPIIKAFWENEYASYSERFAVEAGAAVQNKIGQFTSNPLIRNIIGQEKSSIDMRKIMDEKKIFIMNLSKGKIGEENARLLGAMLITRLYLAAMTRVDVEEENREDFYLYVDEFQNFATESFASILSESRKYRLNLILAHQYIAQMDEKVQEAVFGNVGTMITFRVGAADAELLEKEFSPEFMLQDIVNLGFANIYLRLMIDGVASRPFSAATLPPVGKNPTSYKQQIFDASSKQYGSDRKKVEKYIMEWQGFGSDMRATPEQGLKILNIKEFTERKKEIQRESSTGLRFVVPPSAETKREPSQKTFEGQKLGHESERRPDEASRQTQKPEDRHSSFNERPSASSFIRRDTTPSNQGNQKQPVQNRPTDAIRMRPQAQIPAFDIRRRMPVEKIELPIQKHISLSELKEKEPPRLLRPHTADETIPQVKKKQFDYSAPQQKNIHEKKPVDFNELKKALSEAFSAITPDNEKKQHHETLRDHTGMLRPKQKEDAEKKKEGVLKPGESIRFD